LDSQEERKVVSQEAVKTAKSLLDECNGLFKELSDAIDGKARMKDGVSAWMEAVKKKVKWPSLEEQPCVDVEFNGASQPNEKPGADRSSSHAKGVGGSVAGREKDK
jgi:hypothetical protein